MTDHTILARVLGSGLDLVIPDGEYRLVSGAHVDIDNLPLVEEVAARDGAALVEVPDLDDWVPAVLLRVDAPWVSLEVRDTRVGVPASTTERGHFVALVGAMQCREIAGAWDPAPALDPPGFLIGRDGAWETASFRLVPHAHLARAPVRDWAWPWARAWGPLTLNLHVAATADQLVAFLARAAPMPYVEVEPGRYADRSGHDRGGLLVIADHLLRFVRSYPEPEAEVVAFDAGLIAAVARGDLGELTWDLIDEDHVELVATGDDAASLAEYLSPTNDVAALADRWRAIVTKRTCDATAATTVEGVVELVSVFLGAPRPLTGAEFDAWYHARTTTELPRHLEVAVARTLSRDDHAAAARRLARSRMRLAIVPR